jgi:Protein of unknown function (DUF3626)
MTSPHPRAIEFVTARSTGGLLDPWQRVTLNVHPDRTVDGVPILASLATDGVYRSQFETGTSNGGLTAHPGGTVGVGRAGSSVGCMTMRRLGTDPSTAR